ncbi:MAG TPA: hypothetical protein PLB45_01585 [Bacilli bacterium]|nr:hypothetical protein [Bacilli bacterium]
MDFDVLILGCDANAYYMARCCHEAYHKKPHLIGTKRLSFVKYSNIFTIEYKDIWDEKIFVKTLNEYANNSNNKVLVISTNETYSEFLANNINILDKKLIFPKQSAKVIKTLTNKELFYKTYEDSCLKFPKTIYYKIGSKELLPNIDYPIVIKPANVVSYNHISFAGKEKIYQVKSKEQAEEIVNLLFTSGYDDTIIMQEFIPGDDSYLYDAVCYVDTKGKVKVLSFAEIGIQERDKYMIGNAAALINGVNFHDGPVEQMKKDIICFMEQLGMNGFYEFDLKYDYRSKQFKVLEINARQGRCSYYLTPLGANLVEVEVDDLIKNEDLPYKELNDKVLLSFVPKSIIKKYCLNDEFKKCALKMWKHRVSPMEYKGDTSIKRFLMIKKRLLHYKKEYEGSTWEE